MTFASAAAASTRAIGLSGVFGTGDASVGGTAILDLVSITAGVGRQGQVNSQCTLTALSMPSINPGDDVQVTLSINSVPQMAFRGDFLDQEWAFNNTGERVVSIQCRGLLARLSDKYGGIDRYYGKLLTDFERRAGRVVQNLCEAMGIDADRLFIPDVVLEDENGNPGHWLLGQIQPVWHMSGTPTINTINDISAVVGWSLHDQLNGEIHWTEAAPSGAAQTPVVIFQEGVNATQISRRRTTSHGIINKWTVEGLNLFGVPQEYTISDISPILDAFHPEVEHYFNADRFQSDLVETPNHTRRCAERKLSYTNRRADGFNITLETARPDLLVGDTIGVVYGSLNVPLGARVMIESISISASVETGDASTEITTNGGTLV